MVITSADHGVAKQGISAYPIETTMHMTANYLIAKDLYIRKKTVYINVKLSLLYNIKFGKFQ